MWKLTLYAFVRCWWDWAMLGCSALRSNPVSRCGCMFAAGCRSRAAMVVVSGCGPTASRLVELVDLPSFGRPVRLVWHKRRWRCRRQDCGAGTVTEQDPAIAPPREKLTTRAGRWVTRQVGCGRPLKEIAGELGCSWHLVNVSVRRWGEALLDADVDRIARAGALGLDEHLMWWRGRFATKAWATSIVGVGRGQFLDIVPPRTAQAPARWLFEQPRSWLAGICWAVPEPVRTVPVRVQYGAATRRAGRGPVRCREVGQRRIGRYPPPGCEELGVDFDLTTEVPSCYVRKSYD